jgi:hypothetical protein
MVLHQITKLQHINRKNYQNEEKTYTMGENLSQQLIGERVKIQNILRVQKNSTAKIK